jgi:NAD(P)-dependent dehydrogenase (short-subunit alcohol dehydrogenase family)
MAQDAVLELLAENGGVVLFIVPPARGDGAWRTAVAALHGLARSIAKEYGRRNIRCNVLIGDEPALERLLVDNAAITGELVVAIDGIWGSAGVD